MTLDEGKEPVMDFEAFIPPDTYPSSSGKIHEFFNQVIRDTPNKKAFTDRAMARLRVGDAAGAIADCTEAIRIDPGFSLAYYYRGSILAKIGFNFWAARDEFAKAIELDPDVWYYYLSRGAVNTKTHTFDAAIQDFSAAIKLEDDFEDAYGLRGHAYIQIKQFAKAIPDFDKYLLRRPDDPHTYYNRGVAKARREHLQEQQSDWEAIEDYNKALELDPNHENALFNRSNAYLRLGEYHKAIEGYDLLISLNPKAADVYHHRGVTKYKMGNEEGACKDWIKAKELGFWKALAMYHYHCIPK